MDFSNPKTGKPFSIIAFVGENGCGKTTILNELFNYSKSQYIVDKEINRTPLQHTGRYFATFLRQGQLYYSSMDHIKKLINGEKESFPCMSEELLQIEGHPNAPHSTTHELNTELFNDERITKLFEKDHQDFVPGGKVAKLIDGKSGEDEYDKYSSGQQELIFKLQMIKRMQSYSDFLLMDEPETSLHPRWQKIIIDYICSRFIVDERAKPQIFVATHSEKILESLLGKEDVLIIRLFKECGLIKSESISQMQLLLKKPTFAELDYVIFKIDSYEYCNELYDLLEWLYDVSGDRGVDRKIQKSELYNDEKHHKEWFNEKYNEVTSKTLPVYVRNYFHHPKDKIEPTPEELHEAIELLRNIVLNLKQK